MSRVRGLLQQALPALGALVLVVVGGLTLLAPSANALIVRLGDGASVGVQLRGDASPAAVPGAQRGDVSTAVASLARSQNASNQDVTYNGGPVLQRVSPYLVFWDPSQAAQISARSRQILEQYLTDVAADTGETDDTYGVGRQYYDKTGFADAGQTFSAAAQAISDGDPYPSSGCAATAPAYPTCLTDAQVQTELEQLIADRGLPTGTGSSETSAPVYFVITPADVNICDSSLGCASSEFCSYHSSLTDGPSEVIYAVVPFLPVTPDPKTCQTDGTAVPQEPNGDAADVVVDDLSHESNEAITDPITGTGWINGSSGDEAADLCQYTYAPLGGSEAGGTLYDQLINGDRYYTQTLWSNGDGSCEPAPTGGTVTASFTGPASAMTGLAVGFNPGASAAANGYSSATWSFGDGESEFQIGGPVAVSHAYQSAGSYTVSLTLVDTDGNVATSSQQITVRRDPTPSFNSAPGGRLPALL